jgi:predicted DNA-binding WGR domain protein
VLSLASGERVAKTGLKGERVAKTGLKGMQLPNFSTLVKNGSNGIQIDSGVEACVAKGTLRLLRQDFATIVLELVNEEFNTDKFYILQLLVDGDNSSEAVFVYRRWGRKGTRGVTLLTRFEDLESGRLSVSRVEREKRRKGYQDYHQAADDQGFLPEVPITAARSWISYLPVISSVYSFLFDSKQPADLGDVEEMFYVPRTIGIQDSNILQRELQNLVFSEVSHFDDFYPEVIISYATGKRSNDCIGAGPGMYIAAGVIKSLFQSGIPCFSGLMTPAGTDWRQYSLRFYADRAKAKVLIILLSKAFFESMACLREVNYAIETGVEIIPVRIEDCSSDVARDRNAMWPTRVIHNNIASGDAVRQRRKALRDAFLQQCSARQLLSNVNTHPARGTLLNCKTAMPDLVETVRSYI